MTLRAQPNSSCFVSYGCAGDASKPILTLANRHRNRWWADRAQRGKRDRLIGPSDSYRFTDGSCYSWLPGIHVWDTHDREEGSLIPHKTWIFGRLAENPSDSAGELRRHAPVAGGRSCRNGFGKRAMALAMARNS